MWVRVFFWLLGYIFAIYGGICAILYLNLMTIGFSYRDYFTYVTEQTDVLLLPIGCIIISLSIFYPTQNKEK